MDGQVILFADTETSGFLRRDLPDNDPGQPWVVSVAAELADANGNAIDFMCTRIRAEGRTIKADAENVHGISTRAASKTGVSEIVALGMLCGFANQALTLVGHGIDFDRDVVASVLSRRGKDTRLWLRPGLATVCTMKVATPLCRIPSGHDNGGYKWPSLDEACQLLLGEAPREGEHNPWQDLCRAKRLFLYLKGLGVIEGFA